MNAGNKVVNGHATLQLVMYVVLPNVRISNSTTYVAVPVIP